MKPIKLTLEAFGTFAKKTIIDFTVLSKNGVFLITGETGSGKTTIFDAICYAIYGKANGQDREPKNFRSQFAEPAQETYVNLIFECNGKQYEIQRNPEYYIQKSLDKYSVGTFKVSSQVGLILPDGTVLKKEKDVKSKIKDILGLDCEQFRQIVMIAQGEFKRFLLSKSDDKGEILNTVFGTQQYVNFIDNITKLKESYKIEYLNLMNSIVSDILSISYDTSWSYYNNFERWKNLELENKDIKEVLSNLDSYIGVLLDTIIELSSYLKELDTKINTISKEITSHEFINNTINSRDRLLENLKELQSQQGEIDTIKATLKRLDIAKSIEIDYLNYSKSKNKISKIRIQIDSLKADIQKCHDSIAYWNNQKIELCKTLSTTFNDTDNISIELNTLKNNLINNQLSISEQGKRINVIMDTINKYNISISKLEEHRLELIKKSNNKATLEQNYIECERLYNLNIAGILAEQLQEGVPCMVCGSTYHPNVAVKQDGAISKGQLDLLKNELDRYQDSFRKYQTDFLLEEQNCLNLESKILEQSKEMGISAQDVNMAQIKLLDLRKSLRDDYKSLSIEISKIDDTINNLKSIDDNLLRYSNQGIILDTTKSNLCKQLKDSTLECDTLKDIYYKSLEDNSIESEEIHLNLLNQYRNYNSLNNRVTSFENSVLDYTSRINEYSKTIGENSFIDTSNLKMELSKLQKVQQDYLKRYSIVTHMVKNNSAIYNRVSKQMDSITEKYTQYKDTEYLYKVASGKLTGGTQKVAFDNYVQAYYFEKVITSANSKMQIMSNGRYSLVRSDNSTSKRNRGGLDINIFDSYTGMVRVVSTLSGGETFIASLSLALGLSEVVQQLSGGIRIDAMFIDEGFGTLDSNQSLQQAIKVIDNLATDNRIVGIISHVSELQEHIPNRIQIKKSMNGSTLEY